MLLLCLIPIIQALLSLGLDEVMCKKNIRVWSHWQKLVIYKSKPILTSISIGTAVHS